MKGEEGNEKINYYTLRFKFEIRNCYMKERTYVESSLITRTWGDEIKASDEGHQLLACLACQWHATLSTSWQHAVHGTRQYCGVCSHAFVCISKTGRSCASVCTYNNSTEVPAKLQHCSVQFTKNILINDWCIKTWENSFLVKKTVESKTLVSTNFLLDLFQVARRHLRSGAQSCPFLTRFAVISYDGFPGLWRGQRYS